MKRFAFFLIITLVVLVSGCLIKSLHPFYKEKDLVFRKDLIGVWLDQDSVVWTIEQFKRSKSMFQSDTTLNAYIIRMKDEESESIFLGVLFKLNDIHYVDFFPWMDDLFDGEFYSFHLLPTHSLARIDFNQKNVKISWFNEEWLRDLFKQNKVKIAHERTKINLKDEAYVLTASTDELQKFITKYGNNPEVFECDNNGICCTLTKVQ